MSITSETHNPKLPAIDIYKTSQDSLGYIGTLYYAFYRWEDYGTYLGNYTDYGNTFSHTKTIRFVAGLEIPEDELNKDAIFILIDNTLCFARNDDDKFNNPAVKYTDIGCKSPWSLNLEQVEKNYHLIKIFNPDKI